MKLIPMTDFVISQWDKDITREYFAQSIIKYATFLKQDITLKMFVPCDEYGNVLEDPKCECLTEYDRENCPDKCYRYLNAKKRVLFEEFELVENNEFQFVLQNTGETIIIDKKFTIEDLTFLKFKFYLTDSAIKQLGL